MSELVRQVQLGDTTFGAPEDIEELHIPYGYYKFLGVEVEASQEEIKRAYRRLSARHHPDRVGDDKVARSLNLIADVLLDDGGELGEEHSRRRHYDEVCLLDYYFDEFIKCKDDRTKKFSEIMLINLEMERREAKFEHEISEKYPEFRELKNKLERVRSDRSREKIIGEMRNIAAKSVGLTQEQRMETDKLREKDREGFENRQMEFIRELGYSIDAYYDKVLDVFYFDDGNVTFGTNRNRLRMEIASHNNKENILSLVLGGDCYISGFPKVHFKAPEASVQIQDPNVEGIFHIIKGRVSVDYETSSYGGVIRARAPEVTNLGGFFQKGDLFVPDEFATQNWWRRNPTLDIAVREGNVSLQLRNPSFGYGKYIIQSSLDDLLGEYSDKYTNIINKDYYINKKKY